MAAGRILSDRFALPEHHMFEGGYAKVYKGVDLNDPTHPPVAVKIFRSMRPISDSVLIETWNRELAAYESLSGNNNIVTLIDWGHDDGDRNRYIVFEWVDSDLLGYSERHPIEGWDDLADIALVTLKGLAAVHRAGFVHRDVKPENVLIDSTGMPKLADFGISRAKDILNFGLTLAPYGTPPYMPPEAIANVGPPVAEYSSDVYAFGVLILRMLCGEPLRDRDTVLAALAKVDVPKEVSSFLGTTLAIEPHERPINAQVALAELQRIVDERFRTRQATQEVFVDAMPHAREVAQRNLGVEASYVLQQIVEDLNESPVVYLDDPLSQDGDLMVAGAALLYRCRRHMSKRGVQGGRQCRTACTAPQRR